MGFTRILERYKERNEGSVFTRNIAKVKKGAVAPALSGAFVPSTQEEIQSYAREAARLDRERAKKIGKERATFEKLELDPSIPCKKIDAAALRRMFAKCMAERMTAYTLDKKANPQWRPHMPKYERGERPAVADSAFVIDMQSCIAGFNWNQVTRLVNAAAGKNIQTRDYSEAFHHLQNIMHVVMGVGLDESGARYVLKDRERVLSEWKIVDVKHQRKKRMDKEEDVKRKLHAAASAEEDDNDDDTDEADDEDTGENEDSDEDDEEPVAKKKKVATQKVPRKRKKPLVDEDEDDSETGDDDEEPSPKKKKAAVKKSKRVRAVETADEDDEDDEEEDRPGKRSASAKRSSKKSRSVVEDEANEDDSDDEPKPKRKTKVAVSKTKSKTVKRSPRTPVKVAKLKPDTIIKKGVPRDSGGAKTRLQALVTRAGVAYGDLLAKAKEAELPAQKVKAWIPSLIKTGHLKVVEPAAEAA